MRRLTLATAAALLMPGCGRIGYDAGGDDDPDAARNFTATPCDTPVVVVSLGAAAPSPPGYALDVAVTATGFVAVYSLGGGSIDATGVAMDASGGVENIQTRGFVTAGDTVDLSVAAIGDMVELGVNDPVNDHIVLHDLDAYGYNRGGPAPYDTKRGAGHAFVLADPGRDRFVVAGLFGNSTYAFSVDHDGDLNEPSRQVIVGGSLAPEGMGAALRPGGYAIFAGTTSECTVVATDDTFGAQASPSTIAMTCHHPSAVAAPSSNNVVAAWNCDNDAVWTTGGDPTSPLPGERAVYGDSSNSSSDPRVVATSDGIWYAYAVAGGRLGRALLDASGNQDPRVPAGDVYASPRVKAHDLVSRDDQAYLLWLESGPGVDDELKIMRLCAP